MKLPGGGTRSFRELPSDNQGFSNTGVGGLKQLGVKDLTYKLVFLASSVRAADAGIGVEDAVLLDDEEENVTRYSSTGKKNPTGFVPSLNEKATWVPPLSALPVGFHLTWRFVGTDFFFLVNSQWKKNKKY